MFWTRDAWRACGPLQADSAADYDLCCRFAAGYRFHFIDRVLSSYRLPADPLAPWPGERRRLEEIVAISRRYWGPQWTRRYWRLAISLATYHLDRRRRGLDSLRRCEEELRRRRSVSALVHGVFALLLAPEVVFVCALYARLRRRAPRALKRAVLRFAEARAQAATTLAHRAHTEVWPDGSVGPRLAVNVPAREGAGALRISGFLPVQYLRNGVTLAVRVDGNPVGQVTLRARPSFDVTLALPAPLEEGVHLVEVTASAYFVPRRVDDGTDLRSLSLQFTSVCFVGPGADGARRGRGRLLS